MQKLKIKCRPQDFVVDELPTLPLAVQGEFGVYRLRKEGWNTVDALRQIARKTGLPFARLAYGGKKDRYGLTTQWITIQDRTRREVREPHYSLEFIGWANQPMVSAFIGGNRFAITVRDLAAADADAALRELDVVRDSGLPNYFDDQRFGSYDPRQGFLAKRLFKHQFNEALKTYLTSIHPEDKKPEKDRKRFLDEHWNKWPTCRAQAVTAFEKETFTHLMKFPNDFLTPLNRIPHEDLSMALSAFQSHLWNELFRRLLAAKAVPTRAYPGAVGEYRFYSRLTGEARRYFERLRFPTVDAQAKMPDPLTQRLYGELLAENGLEPSRLGRLKFRQAFLKAVDRDAVLKPQNLAGRMEADDLHPGKQALRLTFTLPRGSYASLVIKRLFTK